MTSLRNKLSAGVAVAVLLSCLIVVFIAQSMTSKIVLEQMETGVLPNILKSINLEMDKEISSMQQIAEQLANDPLLLEKLGSSDFDDAMLVKKMAFLQQYYNLATVSFVDRDSAQFWNQAAYTRQLTREQDGWFFDFKTSGKQRQQTLFTVDGQTRLFVNYQQLHGRGLAGVAKYVDQLVEQLKSHRLYETGFVFLADASGKVQLHENQEYLNKVSLAELYGSKAASTLLSPSVFNLTEAEVDGETVLLASSYIQSAGWTLVAQVRKDEVLADLNSARWTMLLISLVVAGALAFIGTAFAGSITKPILAIADLFKELGQGDGDLKARISSQSNSELDALAKGFNTFVEKLHQSITRVAHTNESLIAEANQLSVTAKQGYEMSQVQVERTTQVATAIHEMGATVSEVASNAANAASTAEETDQASQEGKVVVSRARELTSALSDEIQQVSGVIGQLANRTDEIGGILDVIRGISEQINLLALNAAIEAARAGEHGRGFAVVADEVRGLAKRTNDSTEEIQSMINSLQDESRRAVSAMDESKQQAESGVQATIEADDSLNHIVSGIDGLKDINTQVAAATEEQSAVAEDINKNVSEINDITLDSMKESEKVAQTSEQLRSLSAELDALVKTFKL